MREMRTMDRWLPWLFWECHGQPEGEERGGRLQRSVGAKTVGAGVVGRIMSPQRPRPNAPKHDCYVTWQERTKAADGTKVAGQLTAAGRLFGLIGVGPCNHKGP